jgi:BRCT domain type II-containing protein
MKRMAIFVLAISFSLGCSAKTETDKPDVKPADAKTPAVSSKTSDKEGPGGHPDFFDTVCCSVNMWASTVVVIRRAADGKLPAARFEWFDDDVVFSQVF